MVAPLLLIMLFGIVDFGRAMNYWIDTTHLASEGARFAVVNNWPGKGTITLTEYIRQQGDTNELKSGSGSVTSPLDICHQVGSATVGSPVTIKAKFSFSWVPLLNLGQSTIESTATMRLEAVPDLAALGKAC